MVVELFIVVFTGFFVMASAIEILQGDITSGSRILVQVGAIGLTVALPTGMMLSWARSYGWM